tara:strand:- start:71 stop:511 length:441 start_codon:yes stop_codon:yes gene_type:complete
MKCPHTEVYPSTQWLKKAMEIHPGYLTAEEKVVVEYVKTHSVGEFQRLQKQIEAGVRSEEQSELEHSIRVLNQIRASDLEHEMHRLDHHKRKGYSLAVRLLAYESLKQILSGEALYSVEDSIDGLHLDIKNHLEITGEIKHYIAKF